MPFRKRDGQYYFEAVEILSDIGIEYGELYLALCPLCAAKYKEYIKREPEMMEQLRSAIISGSEPVVAIQLDKAASVRFVEVHFQDLKTILSNSG